MANLKEVHTRIASVSSTMQITSAMKMVSAAKFRRAQNAILGMRPYAEQLNSIAACIKNNSDTVSPYLQERQIKSVLLVVITSNKGLCGAFNANIIKEATRRIELYQDKGTNIKVITLGRKGSDALSKRKELILERYDDIMDALTFDNAVEICENIMQLYAKKEFDFVEIIYNKFKNSITQIPSVEQFLPVGQSSDIEQKNMPNDFIYEPSQEIILQEMIPLTLRSNFYRILLDSMAAEQGARMTAMQKASDNATELLKELKITYNKARQAAITNEIIEIVSGSEALKN